MAADNTAPKTPRVSGSVLSGAGVLIGGRYVVAGLATVSTFIIIHHLTRAQFGDYGVVFSVLAIVGFIADLKLSRIVLSDVLEADDAEATRIVGSYTGLRLVIGVVSYAIAMACVGIGATAGSFSTQVVWGTAIGGLNLVILSAAYGLILLFDARLWFRDVALSNVLGQVASVTLIVAVTVAGIGTLLWYVGGFVVNGVVILGWLAFTLRRSAGLKIVFDPSEWWVWMREAAPLALGAALDTIYFRIDIIMLSIIASSTAAGIYNVGYKFSDLFGAVAFAVATPALTLLVAAWPSDPAAFRRTFRHTLVILAVAAVGACAGFLVYAEPIITTVAGQRYAVGAASARLLVVGQAIHFFTMLAFTTLVASRRNRLYPVAMLVGVVVNVGLNLVLIPEYSYLGSGWATVVTELLVLGVLGVGVMRIPGLRPLPLLALAKTFGAGGVAAAVGLALFGRVPWPVGGAAVGIVYLGLVHVLSPNGPGGLSAFRGDPHDDLAAAIDLGIDRPDLGTGLPD